LKKAGNKLSGGKGNAPRSGTPEMSNPSRTNQLDADATTNRSLIGQDIKSHGQCSFTDDTYVATEDGYVEIGDLEVGDKVLAYNEDTGEVDEYEVTAVHVHLDEEILYLVIDGELIVTTPDHPFYMDGEWIPAGELEAGDEILKADGSVGFVESLEVALEPTEMYNLTVDEAHTFFVGDGQWLVHNICVEYNNPDQDGRHYYSQDRDEAYEFAKKRAGVEGEPFQQFDFYTDKPPTGHYVPGQSIPTTNAGREGTIHVFEGDDGQHKFVVEHYKTNEGVELPHFHAAEIRPDLREKVEDLYSFFKQGGRYSEPNPAHIHYGNKPSWVEDKNRIK